MSNKFKKIKDSNPNEMCCKFVLGEDYQNLLNNFTSLFFIVTKPIKGDLVFFHKTEGIVNQIAIIEKPNKKIGETLIRSTFLGTNGVFEYKLKDSPIKEKFSIWRRR